jgi:TonB-linked SusC/RagA family outer membrane protein
MNFKELLKPLAAAVILTSSIAAVNAQTAGSASDTGRVEEVVVTALGIKKQQRALGYAVQSVKGKELVGSGEQNVVQALSSKVAGALVTSSSGTPGASSRILLRGAATFTGNNQPLFVVDGVPIDNSTDQSTAGDYPFNSNLQGVNNSNRAVDINPDDIETITVLKGPAAASLYGVRGANGAIIITTKRGAKGGKRFSAELSSTMDWSSVNKLPARQFVYGQGLGGGGQKIDSAGVRKNFAGTIPTGWRLVDEGAAAVTPNSWGPKIADGKSFDNAENFFQTAMSMTNNLGVTVNGENTSARFSVGNSQQNGIVPNTTFKRTTVRVNTDSRVTDKLSVGSSVNMINSGGTRAQNGSNLSGVMLGLMRAPADFDLKGGTGADGYTNTDGSQHQYFPIYDNPYWTVNRNPFTDDVNRIIGNVNAQYKPMDWLTLNYRVGTDQYTDSRQQIFAVGSWQPDNSPGGEISQNVLRYRELYSDLVLNANREINKDLGVNVTLGNNLNTRTSSDQYLRGRDLAVPNFYNLSNASNLYASQGYGTTKNAAIFGGAEFAYKNFLYLNASGRNEWASTFGNRKSSFFYPSVSGSLVFSELMEKGGVVSFGKMRVAYAQAGINPPAYATRTYYGQPLYTDGFTGGLGFPYLGQNGFGQGDGLGNQGLMPERRTSTELGFDVRMFDSRLTIDLTLYEQKSTDLLVSMPLAGSSGYGSVRQNSGSMTNRGIELMLGVTAIKNKNLTWEIAANFGLNRNEVLSLAPGVDEINIESAFASIGSYAIVGQSYGSMYGSRVLRHSDGSMIIGANGLPVLNNTRGNIGNPYPDWIGSLRNTLNIKGLNITALVDVRKGGDIWCGTYARMSQYGIVEDAANRDATKVVEGKRIVSGTPKYDSKTGLITNESELTFENNTKEISAFNYYRSYLGDGPGSSAEMAVYDGSWVRLRELGVSYRINLKGNKNLSYVDLGMVGRNLWLSTKYPGVDPETSLTGASSNIGGFDYFNNPGLKSFMFNIKLGI